MASEGSAKSGKGGLVITVGALTVIAAAGGGLTGKMLSARSNAAAAQETPAEKEKPLPYASGTEIKELPPIVTNLAQPAKSHVRLQVAMVYPKAAIENATVMAGRINDDIVAYVKTLSIGALQGPSGLQALREDLNERAAIRSDGKVREIIIETLVVQ